MCSIGNFLERCHSLDVSTYHSPRRPHTFLLCPHTLRHPSFKLVTIYPCHSLVSIWGQVLLDLWWRLGSRMDMEIDQYLAHYCYSYFPSFEWPPLLLPLPVSRWRQGHSRSQFTKTFGKFIFCCRPSHLLALFSHLFVAGCIIEGSFGKNNATLSLWMQFLVELLYVFGLFLWRSGAQFLKA